MIINYKDIQSITLESTNAIDDYFGEPGAEHYKLLAYLSNKINNATIFNIGTHMGYNACALSYNKNNTVYAFDLVDKVDISMLNSNVIFKTDDIMDSDRDIWKIELLNSAIILLDIEPHNGKKEYEFYLWLKENNYNGLLILDDIHYFKNMRDNCWHHIPSDEKYDLTPFGHWSGTGIVTNQKVEMYHIIPERLPKDSSNKSWTIVTAYFNLTKTSDASAQIKSRDISHYMKNSNMTMALDQNLVVFCDTESEAYIRSLRPSYLEHKTKYIIIEFMEIDIVSKNYQRVVDMKHKTGYNWDPRMTSSYYLLCMARYDLLLKAMNDNPFHSTHFSWCNICIERMSWKGDIYFPKIWQEYRDKFSTCYIDYQPKKLVDNIKKYYEWGRCGMCSGFFTGNKYYMTEFCNEIITSFYDMLEQDVGHADEQLFSIVYFRRPDIFEFYYGDYTEMITSYGWIYDRPEEPVKNIIRNLNDSGENIKLLQNVTARWLQAYEYGCFRIDGNIYRYVKNINEKATLNCSGF
jgi:hypothetical protein